MLYKTGYITRVMFSLSHEKVVLKLLMDQLGLKFTIRKRDKEHQMWNHPNVERPFSIQNVHSTNTT